ncbi:hypothetical protein Tco_0376878, partial [Tanacetum coccineum]
PPHPSEDQPQIQPDPSPRPSPTTHIPNSIPEGSGGNHGDWMKTRLARKTSLKKKGVHKEYVSKQGRKFVKSFKGEPSVHKDPAFEKDLDDNVDEVIDYMESEDA